jgi:hypothetical protein
MRIDNIHPWMGKASGGAGPVFRWVWATMVGLSVVGLVYGVRLAMG